MSNANSTSETSIRHIHARRARSRGLTLIEVMIVVAIIAMVAGGVTVVAMRHFAEAKVKTTRTDALALRNAVRSYWALESADDCPTVAALVQAQIVDETGANADVWGKPWKIVCEGTKVTVTSAGPDRAMGTEDDIVVP